MEELEKKLSYTRKEIDSFIRHYEGRTDVPWNEYNGLQIIKQLLAKIEELEKEMKHREEYE